MATATEEDVDYESDPEEAKRLLAMRRREASDDEEGEGEGGEGKRTIRRVGIHSDDSDGQGGAAEYDDEDELGEEVDEDEVAVGVEDVDEGEEVGEEEDEVRYRDRKLDGHGELDTASGNAVKELDDDGRSLAEGQSDLPEENPEGEFSEEKKVNEPFAVPTAGAFYMHDDRFRDNAGGRHRRMQGGRRLWESKDDMKWGHDKFEEITLHERRRGERKTSKGHPRGRGKSQGMDHGYARGNRSRAYNKNNSQNDAPKVVRGRGPRRYESTTDNNIQSSPSQDKQSVKPPERALHNHTGRTSAPPNVEGEPVSVRKHVFASSLNSASPPFYPSGTSSKNILKLEKSEVQAGLPEKNMYGDSRSMPQSSVMVDGRHVVDAVAMDRLYINDSTNPSLGNLSSKTNSGSSVVSNAQIPQSRPQGRGAGVGSTSYPPASLHSQVNKVSLPTQSHGVTRTPSQNRVQPAVQVPVQQLGQRPDSGSQSSSPPKTALSVNSVESGSGEADSYSESSKLKTALVGKGKGMAQGIGAGSFIYSGAQIMGTSGNMNITHGDQNFPHTPAFLPVMQFGGQHPGGIGVPAVGMAFPGYVAQPQLGMGNSEMTWLPVLAGAAGALGATYCSPYIAVDGSYHARPSGQTSSVATLSKENNTNKSSNEAKPSQNELENDDVGQRQNKPRRYSEMNFGQ